jgi:hypothetical protein
VTMFPTVHAKISEVGCNATDWHGVKCPNDTPNQLLGEVSETHESSLQVVTGSYFGIFPIKNLCLFSSLSLCPLQLPMTRDEARGEPRIG